MLRSRHTCLYFRILKESCLIQLHLIFGQNGNFKKKDRQQLNQQQLKKSAAHNLVNFSLLEEKKSVNISSPSPFLPLCFWLFYNKISTLCVCLCLAGIISDN